MLAFDKVVWSPALTLGSRPAGTLLLDSAGNHFLPILGRGRGKSQGCRETPGREEPRPLGTGRRVRACEELGSRAARLPAFLPPCARSRFFFFSAGGAGHPARSLRLRGPRGRSPPLAAGVPARARGGKIVAGVGGEALLPRGTAGGLLGQRIVFWGRAAPLGVPQGLAEVRLGRGGSGKELEQRRRNAARRSPSPELRRPELRPCEGRTFPHRCASGRPGLESPAPSSKKGANFGGYLRCY